MADKTGKTRPKRLSKGLRTHVRRLKQAARKAGIVYIQPAVVVDRRRTESEHMTHTITRGQQR